MELYVVVDIYHPHHLTFSSECVIIFNRKWSRQTPPPPLNKYILLQINFANKLKSISLIQEMII